MSYQNEREEFIARVTREGLPLHVAHLLLREATGIHRRAELACSSEAADRDRVPCPMNSAYSNRKLGPCLCDGEHSNDRHAVTRIAVQDWRAEERIRKTLTAVEVSQNWPDHRVWSFITEGDPRGYTLRVIPPSYAERNAGKDRFNLESIGVPAGPSRLRW